MKNIISDFSKEQLKKLESSRSFKMPEFKVGDTINVKYKIVDGETTRIQAFKGVVISRTKSPSNYSATFTVRKISSGIAVERKFLLHSPVISDIEVHKQGDVRRSKLYYLRSLKGKASRIKEKLDFFESSETSGDSSNAVSS